MWFSGRVITAGFPVSEHLLNSDMSGILKEFYFSKFIYINAKLLGDKLIVPFPENLLSRLTFRTRIIGHILNNC